MVRKSFDSAWIRYREYADRTDRLVQTQEIQYWGTILECFRTLVCNMEPQFLTVGVTPWKLERRRLIMPFASIEEHDRAN